MNCDRIARAYRWIEYLVYGGELERRRFQFLAEVAGARRALLLGDGDGRFLARFRSVSNASIDCIDSSARMLDLARARAGTECISYLHADALTAPLPPSTYDLIVTHFFLDCFNAHELPCLIDRIQAAARPEALWLISEFRQPAWARPLLAAMYLFFRLAASLENNRLVDHRPLLAQRGFRLLREHTSRAGLLVTELWVAPPARAAI